MPSAQVIGKESTPDEISGELNDGPEQYMRNAQAVDEKECKPSSPGVIVDE